MAYNLEKKVSRDAKKAADTTFKIAGALVGSLLGLNSSTKRSHSSGIRRKRPKRW